MASSASNTDHVAMSFLLFPPEVRNNIYQFAFDDLHLSLFETDRGFLAAFNNNSLPLLATSKQINREGLLYKYHNLTISAFYNFLPFGAAYHGPHELTLRAFTQAKRLRITDSVTDAIGFFFVKQQTLAVFAAP